MGYINYEKELTSPQSVKKYIALGGGVKAAVAVIHDVWDKQDAMEKERKRKRKQRRAAQKRNRTK